MVGSQRVFVHRSTDPSAPKFAIHDLTSGTITETDEVWLADAIFRVAPAGWYRAVRERRRVIHAGVFGTLLDAAPRGPRCDCQVRYKVSDAPYFYNDDYRPVRSADVVHLVDGNVYVPREDRWL
jgi:hypothetical protein